MNEKQFVESQKECAKMLGMTLSEYQEYCEKLKVNQTEEYYENENKTLEVLNFLEIDKNKLKLRKD